MPELVLIEVFKFTQISCEYKLLQSQHNNMNNASNLTDEIDMLIIIICGHSVI